MSGQSMHSGGILNTGKPSRVVIEPAGGWISIPWNELWEYRELLYFLVWRDVKVRYKQTILGGVWAVLKPFLSMVVFSVIFGYLADLPSDGIPYPIFTYTALLPWQLFAGAISASGTSLVLNQQLVTKVYFPRLIIPIASVLSGLVDFAIGFIVLLGMMFYYGVVPGYSMLALPVLLLLTIMTALGVGLWLAALNVQYRDVHYTIPFLTQLWLFLTPVAYSSTLIPGRWRALVGLNPMAGVVEGFRWALLGKAGDTGPLVIISIVVVVAVLVGGIIYFRRMEGTFSDVV